MMPAVLVSAPSPPAELRVQLTEAGFLVLDHALGSIPPVDFAPIAAALIEVGEKPDAAAIQTRRWRAELGDDLVPIIWTLPGPDTRLAARGLEEGADVVLAYPLEMGYFLAQVRSGARMRAGVLRLAARANESRLLGEHLQRAHAEADRERAALRRVRLAYLQRSFPESRAARFAVSHRPRGRVGGDFYEVLPLGGDKVAFLVGDVIGPGAASELIGNLATRIASRSVQRVVATQSAGDVLAEVNRELLGLGLADPPLVAMLVGILNPKTGELGLARGGLPAPVYLDAAGMAEAWPVPGPFLGTTETVYATRSARLRPGDKLTIGTDGIRTDGDPGPFGDDRLLEAAVRYRELTNQSFVDAVARDLLADVTHEDDFTLLTVEMASP